jgi:hypothetical protein
VVANLEVRDVRPDDFHYARGFVAQNCRRGYGKPTLDDVEITVTDPRCRGSHEHFTRPGLVDLDILEHERFVPLPHD